MSKKSFPKYSPEVRDCAVCLMQEARKEYPSQCSSVESIAPKSGCAVVTLQNWVGQCNTLSVNNPWRFHRDAWQSDLRRCAVPG